MKRQIALQTTEKPAIFKLMPEDRFFKRIADLRRLIERRAYQLFSTRGFTHGHDLEDWLQAESEILKAVPLEVSETENALTVKAILPGYSGNDIEIHVEPQRLFLCGQRHEKSEEEKSKSIHSVVSSEWMFRSVELPAQIDPEKVRATLSNGELQIELTKRSSGKTVAAGRAAA